MSGDFILGTRMETLLWYRWCCSVQHRGGLRSCEDLNLDRVDDAPFGAPNESQISACGFQFIYACSYAASAKQPVLLLPLLLASLTNNFFPSYYLVTFVTTMGDVIGECLAMLCSCCCKCNALLSVWSTLTSISTGICCYASLSNWCLMSTCPAST